MVTHHCSDLSGEGGLAGPGGAQQQQVARGRHLRATESRARGVCQGGQHVLEGLQGGALQPLRSTGGQHHRLGDSSWKSGASSGRRRRCKLVEQSGERFHEAIMPAVLCRDAAAEAREAGTHLRMLLIAERCRHSQATQMKLHAAACQCSCREPQRPVRIPGGAPALPLEADLSSGMGACGCVLQRHEGSILNKYK